MKNLRNTFLTALVTLFAFVSITYTACKKDPCKDITCNNGGSCNSGTCSCVFGYEGSSCETEIRTKYYNTYKGNGVDKDGEIYEDVSIRFKQSGNEPKLMVMDLIVDEEVLSFAVTLQTATTFTITPVIKEGTNFSGSGTVTATLATLTLEVTDGGDKMVVTFPNMVKQ